MENVMGLAAASGTRPVYSLSLDAKRRPTLPAALLDQVHILADEDIIATPIGEGTILLQNRSAALIQARKNVRAGFNSPVAAGAVDRFQQERRADHERNDVSFKARRASEASDSEASERVVERGEALLATLGL